MRRLFVSGIIVLSLFLLISVLPSQIYAVSPDQKCVKILRYTFCFPLPPKPPPPPPIRPTVTPRRTPTPTITRTPTPSKTPTPTLTPTPSPSPTATPTPNTECSGSTICGNSCTYGGGTYNTVLIGTQCWFKNNLNVGTMLTDATTMPDDIAPSLNEPSTVQKWCYNDSSSNCSNEGGLYLWAEANGLPNLCNYASCLVPTVNQGICPAGWHVPTDTDFYILEKYLTTSGQTCEATRIDEGSAPQLCADAGTKLMPGGSSGFDAPLAGSRDYAGYFARRGNEACFWSSSFVRTSYAWARCLYSSYPGVTRFANGDIFGDSVRCISDTTK